MSTTQGTQSLDDQLAELVHRLPQAAGAEDHLTAGENHSAAVGLHHLSLGQEVGVLAGGVFVPLDVNVGAARSQYDAGRGVRVDDHVAVYRDT